MEAWTLAKQWRVRPSELYGISHPVTAFCFDRAVQYFGTSFEADVEAAVSKVKNDKSGRGADRARRMRMKTWMGDEEQAGKGQFRDPFGGGQRG